MPLVITTATATDLESFILDNLGLNASPFSGDDSTIQVKHATVSA